MDDGCGVVFVIMALVFVVGLVVMFAQNEARARELREAEVAYRSSLMALKASPTDADLKEETLRRGRFYSNLTRNRRGVTMYDEVALMNDINAACARAGIPETPKQVASKTVEERLGQLLQLKEKGLITDPEYDQRRADILKEI